MISTPRSSTRDIKVVVIGISTDADTTLANWAHDSGFPNLFASDPDQTVAKLYGSADAKVRYAQRVRRRTRRTHHRAHHEIQRAVGGRVHRARQGVAATLKPPGGGSH